MLTDTLSMEGIFEEGYGIISKKVMRDKTISLEAKGIYSYLCSFSGKGKDAFPSQALMQEDLGVSKNTLSKHLKALKNQGFIEVIQMKKDGKFSKNLYRIKLVPCTKNWDTEESTVYQNLGYQKLTPNNNSNNNNKKENIKRKKSSKKITLSEEELKTMIPQEYYSTFKKYYDERSSRKKPMSKEAVRLAVKKLEASGLNLSEKIDCIENSIMNGYQGLFPKKAYASNKTSKEPIGQNKNFETKSTPLSQNEIYELENQKIDY